MGGEIEDVIPIGDYETLLKRIQRSERLNGILFFSILLISFVAFIAVGVHSYRYEKRLHQIVREFKRDILVVAANQNAAIRDLNQVVLNRDWINYQRLSLEQLQDFSDLAEMNSAAHAQSDASSEAVGGK